MSEKPRSVVLRNLLRFARPELVAIITAGFLPGAVLASTWTVAHDGEFPSIRSAVAHSAPGDTIVIQPGHYRESGVDIDKELVLKGRGYPRIDSADGGEIFTVRADGVRIEGLSIENVGTSYVEDRAGVRLVEVKACFIEDNRFYDNFFAIYLENSEDCVIRRNDIRGRPGRETAAGNGIHLWYCRNILVEDNRTSSHRDGIYFEFVEDSTIRGNVSENNLRYGLHFMFSHRDEYVGNVFRHNGAGVAVMFSDFVTMRQNRFEHNWGSASYGLLLKDIRDSEVSRNQFHRNTTGLYSEGSTRLTVRENEFTENGYAIKMMGSSQDGVVSANNFINNTFDVATNSKQNTNEYSGNYWSGYRGYDLDRDGVGDVPYRPVHLFSLLVEREPAGLILLRSFFIDLINVAEQALPMYTPTTLLDARPATHQIRFEGVQP